MMNKYYPLIERLIAIRDCSELSEYERDAIAEACNALSREGDTNAQNEG